MSLKFKRPTSKEDYEPKIWTREGPPAKKKFYRPTTAHKPTLSQENQAYKDKLRMEEEEEEKTRQQVLEAINKSGLLPPVPISGDENRVKEELANIAPSQHLIYGNEVKPSFGDIRNGNAPLQIFTYTEEGQLTSQSKITEKYAIKELKVKAAIKPHFILPRGAIANSVYNGETRPAAYNNANENIVCQHLPPTVNSIKLEAEITGNNENERMPVLSHPSPPPTIQNDTEQPAQQHTRKINGQYKPPKLLVQSLGDALSMFSVMRFDQQNTPTSHSVVSSPGFIDLKDHPDNNQQQVTTVNPNDLRNNANSNIPPNNNAAADDKAVQFVAVYPTGHENQILNPDIQPDPLDPAHHCRACNKPFKKVLAYRSHLRQTHKMTNLPSIKSYPPHLLPDPRDPNNYCRICKKTAKDIKLYRDHMRHVHFMAIVDENMPQADPNMIVDERDPRNTSCKYCKIKYSDGDHYRRHMKRHHQNGNTRAVRGVMRINPDVQPDFYDENNECKSCEQKWASRDKYKYHLIMLHDIEVDESPK